MPTPLTGVNVAAPVVPFTDADTFPTHEAIYGLGGWREVANYTARDAIPSLRQEVGMMVYVLSDQTFWQLTTVGDPGTYSQIFMGSAGNTGYTGYTGYTGAGNFTGYTGYTGPIGYTGYTGYTGPGNFTGYSGYTGYTGPQGAIKGLVVQSAFLRVSTVTGVSTIPFSISLPNVGTPGNTWV